MYRYQLWKLGCCAGVVYGGTVCVRSALQSLQCTRSCTTQAQHGDTVILVLLRAVPINRRFIVY